MENNGDIGVLCVNIGGRLQPWKYTKYPNKRKSVHGGPRGEMWDAQTEKEKINAKLALHKKPLLDI